MSTRLHLLPLWLCMGLFGCVVLTYACLMPHPPQVGISYFDKVEHFLAYLILAAWFAEVLPTRPWQVFTGLVLFGLLIEVAQSMTGYRHPNVMDLVADTVGVVAGMLLARLGAMRWLDYIDCHVPSKRN